MEHLHLIEDVYQNNHIYNALYIAENQDSVNNIVRLFQDHSYDVVVYKQESGADYHQMIVTTLADMDADLFVVYPGINYIFVAGDDTFKTFAQCYKDHLDSSQDTLQLIKL
jgi:hypothetical protein